MKTITRNPAAQAKPNQNITSLANRAVLVSLSISQWNGQKTDVKASLEVTKNHKAETSRGQFIKKLVSGKESRTVKNAGGALRRYHLQNTFPWGENLRILPRANLFTYMQRMGELEKKFNESVEGFLKALPAMQASAKLELGTLYDEADYPDAEELRDLFGTSVAMVQLPPEGDWRLQLSDESIEGLRGHIEEQVQRTFRALHQDAAQRIGQALSWLAETMGKEQTGGKGFHSSYLAKLIEVCSTVKELGLDDPILTTSATRLQAILSQPEEALRSNESVRKDATQQAKDMLATLNVCLNIK